MKALVGMLFSCCLMIALVVPGNAAPGADRIDRALEDCGIPPEVTPPIAVSTQPSLRLRALFLVDRGDLELARSYATTTVATFDRIGIDLKGRFKEVDPPEEWDDSHTFATGPNHDEILGFMHSLYATRPPRTDVVYFFTRFWAGGFAECVGGVRFDDRSFAFGSLNYSTEDLVPSPTTDEGVIAAHEIGHLLGAHHHYANCVEALPSGTSRGDTNPCTTMWPAAANASSTFGLIERSFVRYYVERFAGT